MIMYYLPATIFKNIQKYGGAKLFNYIDYTSFTR